MRQYLLAATFLESAQVDDEQIEGRIGTLERGNPLGQRLRHDHGVTLPDERPLENPTDQVVVINDENAKSLTQLLRLRCRALFEWHHGDPLAWEVDVERGTLGPIALDDQSSPGALHDPVHGPESKPGPTSPLRCVVTIEHPLSILTRNPRSGVGYHEVNVPACGQETALDGQRRIDFGVDASDRDLTTPRHRVLGIQDEVEDNLLDLYRIALGEP